MKSLNEYLEEYALSHRHKINVYIHVVCVPLIMFSILGILKAMPVPVEWPMWLDWSAIGIIFILFFYSRFKNRRLFLVMTLFIFFQILVLEILRPRFFLLSLSLFLISWIAQFVGHFIEGKKPSFLNDLRFLLIGPIWVFKSFILKGEKE